MYRFKNVQPKLKPRKQHLLVAPAISIVSINRFKREHNNRLRLSLDRK